MKVIDPEGVQLAAIRRVVDLAGLDVLEVGCGDGRLTLGIAADAARVHAYDPDVAKIELARGSLPPALADRVVYATAQTAGTFDAVIFSWSL